MSRISDDARSDIRNVRSALGAVNPSDALSGRVERQRIDKTTRSILGKGSDSRARGRVEDVDRRRVDDRRYG